MIIEASHDDIRIEGDDRARGYGLAASELEGHLWIEVFNSSDGNHTMINAKDAARLGFWLVEWAKRH